MSALASHAAQGLSEPSSHGRRAAVQVRYFKQARSARTYRALLDAAADVFAKAGYDAAQTPDIARHAGVSTGAFYRYFDDKRQAFLEVCAQRLEASISEVAVELRPERFDVADARGSIDLVLDVLFTRIRRDAPIDRVFLVMSLRDPEVRAMRGRIEALGVDLLARVIEAVIPRSVVPHPRAGALVIYAAALEVASELAGISPRRDAALPEAQVREALREMIHRYLYPVR